MTRRSVHRARRISVVAALVALLSLLGRAPLGAGEAVADSATVALSAPSSFDVSSLAALVERPSLSRLPPEVDDGPEPLFPERTVSREPRPGEAVDSDLNVLTGRVPKRGTLAGALRGAGITPLEVDTIARSLRPVFDFRRAQPGDFYALIRSEPGDVLSFEFQRGRERVFRLSRGASGSLVASSHEAPLNRRVIQLGGVVRTTLFDSMAELGEAPELARDFADIFLWDFDFARQTRPGDEFRVVFEKLFDKRGFVRYGRVLAAEYRADRRNLVAVYFEDEDGNGDYFTPDGNSVKRAFLKAPVRYARISAKFTHSRYHPILRTNRPHEGVDYAAPIGTPVWAVADGQVIYTGWNGGYGRLVKIRHSNGFVSYYGHLSRFARNLRVGQRVRQKELVGHVGSSGMSTGPHLDFRLQSKGRFVDPLNVKLDFGEPIPPRARVRFDRVRALRLAELKKADPELVLDAAM